ncbi:MAG: YtxH domain-containing protein [Bacilli bacterium]|nr:YtxH domain-containing protein [Bacilli bacterium]
MKKKTVATLVAGTAIGAGLGVLFAPKSGKETRQDLKNKITELKEKLENVKVKDVKKYVSEKIEKLETDLKALDKETVLKAAKNKAKKIEADCKKLARYVKDKSEPILEEAVDALRVKAIEVTKQAIEKLENK